MTAAATDADRNSRYLTKYVLEVPEAFKLVDATYPTASWYDVLEIQSGRYEVEWTNINGRPWNPDPDAHTPGYIANIGAYYATASLDAILRRTYREARLLSEVRATETHPDEKTVHHLRTYAYTVSDGAPAMHQMADYKPVARAFFRAC